VVEIFAFLELEHKLPFFKGLVAGHGLIRPPGGPNQMKNQAFFAPMSKIRDSGNRHGRDKQ
jgi:hypothetical protein